MTGFAEHEPLRLLGTRVAPAFERHVRVLPAGYAQPVDATHWTDALVDVAQGEIELELTCGDLHRFRAGDVLWLDGLPLRLLRNRGSGTAVLVAVRRRPR